jgi:hypothetical protein
MTDVTHPALSVSDTVYEAFCRAKGEIMPDALAAAITQWVRETIEGKHRHDLIELSDLLHEAYVTEDITNLRAALLTFMGVNPT